MDLEFWFLIANTSVLPAWMLLFFAPRWTWTKRLVHPAFLCFGLGVMYVVFLVLAMSEGIDGGSFSSLAGVTKLFRQPIGVLAGWIHYLAFDLFVGAWEVRDAEKLGISHFAVIPCLLFTFLLGPLGLGLYLAIRWSWKRQFAID